MRDLRPSAMWRIANGAGATIFIVGGIGLSLANTPSNLAIALTGIPAFSFGVVWLVRIFQVKASFDSDTLYLRNLFRNVEVAREQITDVDTDPRSAQVSWTSASGRPRVVTVSAAGVGSRYILPLSTLSREQAFLRSVQRWSKRRRA